MPILWIAMSDPPYGNYEHWALHLTGAAASPCTVLQVVGQHPDFVYNVEDVRAEPPLRRKLRIATVEERDVGELRAVLARQPIDNETVEWDCQDFVLEALESLKDEYIIEEGDEDYEDGVRLAKEYYGAM